ncbi:MAG: ABC transporter ATP-binding protein [Pseudomonadota bacterium]
MSSEIAVKIENLSKCHQIYEKPGDRLWQMLAPDGVRRYREFWALKNVSIDIRKGETVGIIGRNGSGKSTLLQLICKIAAATTGTVQTQGRIAALLELGSGFNPDFTGRENVYMNAAILGLSRLQIDERFDEITAFANIGDFIEQPTKTYSSGMMLRLAFAVSVCVDPNVLIIDEALAVGDASFQFKCLDRLAALTERGTTLLFVSHDMNMVKRFCHRVIYLKQGEIRASGSPAEMAELYLLDMRDEQRQWAGGAAATVALKPFLGTHDEGIAYGTQEGRIVSACFTNTQSAYSSFVYGDELSLRIEVLVRESISQPNLSITIQEPRLLVIGGENFPLSPEPAQDGWKTAAMTVSLRAILAAGRYHITLRLLDGSSEETSQLIEKQVGVLAFDMLPASKNFLGIVDLNFRRQTAS